ncbi:MAG: hypothetical protein CL678_13150 [Bdellovibrionaceae bacterium]|nr:hypothetical protein [Pseudobdellovibrionaceae bacterium]|tara:strand:- start:7485 stop:9428 length:1944 start_codon:yes stop_codon:yes gene_type:complete
MIKKLTVFFLYFFSFVLIRQEIVSHSGLSFKRAWELQLYMGWMEDFFVSAIPFLFSQFLFLLLRIPRIWTFSVLSTVLWLGNLSHVLYYKFFNQPLDWWVVTHHFKDVTVVGDSAGTLGVSFWILGSFLTLVVTLTLFPRSYPLITPYPLLRRVRSFFITSVLLAFILSVKQSPVWFHWKNVGGEHLGSVFNSQIFTHWWFTWSEEKPKNKRHLKIPLNALPQILTSESNNPDFPLFHSISTSKTHTKKLRDALGFKEEEKINVIYLFLESVRSFEIAHPKLGTIIWPKLNKILKTKAISFSQAYSSSIDAGQTVRGQFSVECSFYPHFLGAAVYLSHPFLKITCLPEILKKNGFQTFWMNSFKKNFHNKATFESLHGIDFFFDEMYFKEEKKITQKIGNWGIADHLFFKEVLSTLENLEQKEKPFYANILSISTHHPFSVVPEGPLPDSLLKATEDTPEYQGYLSRLKYLDDSVDQFFTDFFERKISENTVVVLMGDHSTFVKPHLPLNKIQQKEMEFRIPVALISKKIKRPQQIKSPIHQIDIAPLTLSLLGIEAETSWLGRDPIFYKQGSPWIYTKGNSLFFRDSEAACYHWSDNDQECIHSHSDPLWATRVKRLPAQPEKLEFYEMITKEVSSVIENDQIEKR